MNVESVTTVVGNLVSGPVLTYTPGAVPRARFTVAVCPRTFDPDTGTWRDGDPVFLPCVAWRGTARNLADSLRKGHRVVVTGRLRHTRASDRSPLELEADEVGAALRFANVLVTRSRPATVDADADGTVKRPANEVRA